MPAHPATPSQRQSLLTALTTAALIATTASTAKAQTQTLYVDDDAPLGGNGTTWNTAFRELQDALDIANQTLTGTVEIRIAQGTYIPPNRFPGAREFRIDPPSILSASAFRLPHDHDLTNLPRLPVATHASRDTPQLTSGVTIKLEGGYAGMNTPIPNERDPNTFVSILSADILRNDNGTPASRSDNAAIVLNALMPNNTKLDLDGLRVTAANSSGYAFAAGVRLDINTSARVALAARNCVFSGTTSYAEGAGLWSRSVTSYIENCVFEDMTLGTQPYFTGHTGGLVLWGSLTGSYNDSAYISFCAFRRNTGARGGGMNAAYFKGPIDVYNSHFEDNTARAGGAIGSGNYEAQIRTWNTDFIRNTAEWGGAVEGRINAWQCDFIDNKATWASVGGGAVYAISIADLESCRFIGNTAAGYGGAIKGSITARHCTFEDNRAAFGGAVSNGTYYSSTVYNSTFRRNRATIFGGAILADEGVSLSYCVFDRNEVVTDSNSYPPDAFGGAVHAAGASIQNCKFFGNAARSATSHAAGGAVFSTGGVIIGNSIFSGNAAIGRLTATGGAIIVGAGADLSFLTITRNLAHADLAPAEGAGFASGFGLSTLHSSILWQNTATGTPTAQAQIVALIPFFPVYSRFNVVSGLTIGYDAERNTGADPLLTDLDGPDEIAGTPDDDLRIASLQSPCIDASLPTDVGCCDADGRPRAVDAPLPWPPYGVYSIADRGALEYQGSTRCELISFDNDGDVDTVDLATFLRNFGRGRGIPGMWPDFNNDGYVDTKDLIRLLGVFGCTRWG